MKLLVIGPQGSGKGTQAKLLSKKLNIPHISSGELFREHIENKTQIGQKAQKYILNGILVPDLIVEEMISDRISKNDCKNGFILDGYPRTIIQATNLQKNTDFDAVIFINITKEESLRRLSNRRVCPNCGKSYNLNTYPKPKRENLCDDCNIRLEIREDATKKAELERQEWYEERTVPLINYYKDKGILKEVNGMGKIDEIAATILKIVQNIQREKD